MSKHTPTPWRVEPDETCDEVQGYDIRTDNEEIVGQEGILAGPLGEANAAFIVRAVNAHEALVEALRLMMTGSEHKTMTVGGITITGWSTIRMPDEAALDAARAALALVEPKP